MNGLSYTDMTQTVDASVHDQVRELTPSAKLVYYILQVEGSMTQNELREASRLPPRTSCDAIDRLLDAGVIEEVLHFQDLRMRRYRIVDGGESTVDSVDR